MPTLYATRGPPNTSVGPLLGIIAETACAYDFFDLRPHRLGMCEMLFLCAKGFDDGLESEYWVEALPIAAPHF
jgi:hypothetical protein